MFVTRVGTRVVMVIKEVSAAAQMILACRRTNWVAMAAVRISWNTCCLGIRAECLGQYYF